MISFEKKYNKMGYIKILKVNNKQYSQMWEYEGDNIYTLVDNLIISKIEKDEKLKEHKALINEILYSRDDEIPYLIIALENALKEDKNNKQCNKCKHWAEGYKTIKAQCGLFNQKCKFELKEMREDKGK